MKSIAVLITCHNRKYKTLACLKALNECILPKEYVIEVYLVDDGSTDGTAQIIHENFPNVHILQGDGTLFWNRGMYLAWNKASIDRDFDYFLWLNDDTLLNHDALSILLNGPINQIIVGSTRSKINKEITYGGFDKRNNLIYPKDKFIACEYFNGNIVLIPRSVFEKVGFNDEFFKHALGDFDYGLRALKKKIELVIAPEFLGVCEQHEEKPTWCNPNKSFLVRWKAFRTPIGHNPEEYYVYEKRHNGVFKAIFHYFTNHLRVFIPYIWK